jgi:nucleoside-diphosphate-sugar epimerase
MTLPQAIIAVTGSPGISTSISRPIANSRRVFLCNIPQSSLDNADEALKQDGCMVETNLVDRSSYSQVKAYCWCSGCHRLQAVVHTAGVFPSQGSVAQIMQVDLLGTANILDAFYEVAGPGQSIACIGSGSAHLMEEEVPSDVLNHPARSLAMRSLRIRRSKRK